MSYPGQSGHRMDSHQNSSNNTNNQTNDGNYYDGNLSSMSALASVADAQGHQQSNTMQAHDIATSSSFSDMDTQLNMYGSLDPSGVSQAYGDFEMSTGLDGHQMAGAYGPSAGPFGDWYPQMGNGIPTYLENFPQMSGPQPSIDSQPQMRAEPALTTLAGPQQAPVLEPKLNGAKAPSLVTIDTKEELHERGNGASPISETSKVSTTMIDTPALKTEISALQAPNTEAKESLAVQPVPDSSSFRSRADFRPKTSIPSDLEAEEYAQQCIAAAYASRLNPFGLHQEEHKLLRSHLNHLQVTSYLNIRNGILRLWTRNPLVSVTREEAAGCAKDYRWFDLAELTYEWLVRSGYINFGCVEVPNSLGGILQEPIKSERKTIVVIGAGMAGLGCARQLQGLFQQFEERLGSKGMDAPNIIILEGRERIGGRVYSHPLKKQSHDLPNGSRCTADMGAQIITGFDHGNPLSIIIRGQLALRYHSLKDNAILYDSNGRPVDKAQDTKIERLYNDILDRASVYRHKMPIPKIIEGDKELIELGRDPTGEGGKPMSILEDAASLIPVAGIGFSPARNGLMAPTPVSVDKLTGRANMTMGSAKKEPASETARSVGLTIKPFILSNQTLDLDASVKSSAHPSLGKAMDEAVRQYQDIVELRPQDMRLLNWHFANLEYANASNVRDLSLGGWDLDIGNEFEGEHAQIVGGYQQVPRGLWLAPNKLDVRKNCIVKRIHYRADNEMGQTSKIECENGEIVQADVIISTLPLGVLKAKSVDFEPPLPGWKEQAIERLGFGTLNKVILVYDSAFWDIERDMVGLLRDPDRPDSLNQADYASRRGRFYLFWNCIKTSGRPMLVALMAGDAAHQTELASDAELISEVTTMLGNMFPTIPVPEPSEAIITRWGKDRFANGSYSYVATTARPDDYETIARPVGNLFFAGEHTCGTHPASVHGAYLSGLRVASEVFTSLLGPIQVPTPLVPQKASYETAPVGPTPSHKRKAETASSKLLDLRDQRMEAYEAAVRKYIFSKIGDRPVKPGKSGANPFLLYQKDHWFACKAQCDAVRQQATKNPDAKAGRNEVRAALGLMWRQASEDVQRPYLEKTKRMKEDNERDVKHYADKLTKWDREAGELGKEYRERWPNAPSEEEKRLENEVEEERGEKGRKRRAEKGETEVD
ncbi:MAG: hypothetical protein M1824_001214 [Vezdaea acicularis]|nr:MAG: hypothetical protein M1824_001214 [Vezdaea acicularis]